MKNQYLTLLVLSVGSILFAGCEKCPEPREPDTVVEYRYIDKKIPKVEEKPAYIEYRVIMVKFEGKDYYALTRADGTVMVNNWILYKDWAENNYKILKSLENNTTK